MPRGQSAPEYIREVLAKTVRAARRSAQLGQRDSCSRTSISQSYLSQYEAGKWNIGVDNIAKIAQVVGLRPHDLLNPDFRPPMRELPVRNN
jgi:transcriptional regulator with XRE-family HTH domain